MPVYEYRCDRCGVDFERLLFSSSTRVACPSCGAAEVTRRPSSFGMSGVEHQTTQSGGCTGCHASSCAGCGGH